MTTSAFGVPHGAEDISKVSIPGLGAFKQVAEALPHAQKMVGHLASGNWAKAARSGTKAVTAAKGGATKGFGGGMKTATKWVKKNPGLAVGGAAAGGAALGYGAH